MFLQLGLLPSQRRKGFQLHDILRANSAATTSCIQGSKVSNCLSLSRFTLPLLFFFPLISPSLRFFFFWMICSFFFCCAVQTGSERRASRLSVSIRLHLISSNSTSPQIYHLALFSSPKALEKEGNYSFVLTEKRGLGAARKSIAKEEGGMERRRGLRQESEKCDSCKRWRGGKKEEGMSIIDCDDPSRMAVFPRGGDGEQIPARVTTVGGR